MFHTMVDATKAQVPVERCVPPVPNGTLILRHGFRKFAVIGGPFDAMNVNSDGVTVWGLCLDTHSAKAVNAGLILPWPDFGVPVRRDLISALGVAIDRMFSDGVIYIGCRGGIGRTGTAMAVLARAFGALDGVGFVRDRYLAHAVETRAQQGLVDSIDVSSLKARIQKQALSRHVESLSSWFRW